MNARVALKSLPADAFVQGLSIQINDVNLMKMLQANGEIQIITITCAQYAQPAMLRYPPSTEQSCDTRAVSPVEFPETTGRSIIGDLYIR